VKYWNVEKKEFRDVSTWDGIPDGAILSPVWQIEEGEWRLLGWEDLRAADSESIPSVQ